MVRKFWWGHSNKKNKMAWLSWEKILLFKDQGGLGFQDLKAFNLALVGKTGMTIANQYNSLVHVVFKAYYFPSNDFHHVELGNRPSFEWRSIMAAQSIIQHRHRWQVGDGSSIDIREG